MDSLTVCLIVKNEESCLERCLESVKDIGQIVIVDTGSTDSTIDIARKYTDKVFTDYTWNDNFAEARNHAISKCETDWIFTIDADEHLVNPEEIDSAIKIAAGQGLSTINAIIQSENGSLTHKQPRLYKSNHRWHGAIHNYLDQIGQMDSAIKVVYGYSEAHKLDPDRAMRILTKEVQKPGKVRELYYLAREYWYRALYEKAIEWYEKYLKVSTWSPEKADAHLMMAKCYKNIHDLVSAVEHTLKAIQINNDFKEALEMMADLSGPKNSARWLNMAYHAKNEDVLFAKGMNERGSDYYNKIAPSYKPDRYLALYERMAYLANGDPKSKILDIGCGEAFLDEYISNYTGIDFCEEAVKIAREKKRNVSVANIYDFDYSGYNTFIFSEVLEHIDDLKVLGMIPSASYIIASVPSFADPSHLRRYTDRIVRERYDDMILFTIMERFNWKNGKWVPGGSPTNSHITLFAGVKK